MQRNRQLKAGGGRLPSLCLFKPEGRTRSCENTAPSIGASGNLPLPIASHCASNNTSGRPVFWQIKHVEKFVFVRAGSCHVNSCKCWESHNRLNKFNRLNVVNAASRPIVHVCISVLLLKLRAIPWTGIEKTTLSMTELNTPPSNHRSWLTRAWLWFKLFMRSPDTTKFYAKGAVQEPLHWLMGNMERFTVLSNGSHNCFDANTESKHQPRVLRGNYCRLRNQGTSSCGALVSVPLMCLLLYMMTAYARLFRVFVKLCYDD